MREKVATISLGYQWKRSNAKETEKKIYFNWPNCQWLLYKISKPLALQENLARRHDFFLKCDEFNWYKMYN